ncbi:MAG: nucleoside deaminase [Actinobacteria bacterium]|nr:nucleoside deaminase [Actinomycetota bacterium]
MTSIDLMREAIAVAHQSRASNDVPVGALIVDPSGKIIATGTNEREAKSDPRKAATDGWRLDNHTLVVTLEPCAMCAGAIAQARISKVIFGAWDEKAGAAGSVWDVLRDPRAIHRVEVESGVLQEECAALLSDFFRSGQ